ncbi:MAG: class I SAM-dependent methyltransferase [archaeon]|nr:class I SAM-dependent methyltransferase [Nanoarchaeota archaeon]
MFDKEKIIAKIKELEEQRKEMYVSKDSIDFLLKFIKQKGYKKILEIGTFEGYSALNFSLVAERVVTLENHKNDIEEAKKNLESVDNVEIIKGDARKTLKTLNEKFDLILIDGGKREYKEYLELVLPLLNNDGAIFADNTISHKEGFKEFFNYLNDNKESLNYKELELGKGLLMIRKN